MNIYKLIRDDIGGYDTYDSAVVVAENEEQAKKMHPSHTSHPYIDDYATEKWWEEDDMYKSWTHDLSKIQVTLIGKANKSFDKPQVIVASYNAG